MATGSRQGQGPSDSEPTGATEPITLTDPDGAVTRVAPWSSWTREQVRAPGGEPALVTRLDQGQLWFSAGRRRSPWRHEVHVGPAVVSTPRGRFQAIAEPDGGATIACLAGRTRVVAGLREPVLLGPDQSAAVSSDGRTLVVMDRESGAAIRDDAMIDLTDAALAEEELDVEHEAAQYAAVGAAELAVGTVLSPGLPPRAPMAPDEPGSEEPAVVEAPPVEVPPARLGWIPELVAVAAVVGLIVAAIWVFAGGTDTNDDALPIATTVPVTQVTTTDAPSTTATATSAPTTAPVTSAVPTTSEPRPSAAGATGTGALRSCRRADGGVVATVAVTHRSGPASRFTVSAGLVDSQGRQIAQASADTGVIQPGGTGQAEVLVPVAGRVTGSCELLAVTSR